MSATAEVRMYTTRLCGYCMAARRLLDGKGVAYEEIRVDRDREQRAEMERLSGRHTVPQVFIDGDPVGGYDDIAALDASGELDRLLGLQSND